MLVLAVGLLAGSTAQATSSSAEVFTLAQLQDGASFLSGDGNLEFSDFGFTAIGFDEAAFDDFIVVQRERGFRMISEYGAGFGPGAIEMTYTVTAGRGLDIDSASIPFLGLFDEMFEGPLEVAWMASNGASLTGSSDDDEFPWGGGISTSFDPITSLMVEQVSTLPALQSGSGRAKVENGFTVVDDSIPVPEPASGALLGLGLLVALSARGRSRS
jgi:hypothetical protein